MTESFGPYCGDRLDIDMPPSKWGSCGRPFDGIEVRIADPDTRRRVPAGTEGEIQLRGPNMMRGICGRTRSESSPSTATTARVTSAASMTTATSGTSGRLDDMFKVSGATVYPTEVEAALRSHPGCRAGLRHEHHGCRWTRACRRAGRVGRRTRRDRRRGTCPPELVQGAHRLARRHRRRGSRRCCPPARSTSNACSSSSRVRASATSA